MPPVNKSPPGKGSKERTPGIRGGGSFNSSTLYFVFEFLLKSGLRFVLLDGLAKAQGRSDISVSVSLLATLNTYKEKTQTIR